MRIAVVINNTPQAFKALDYAINLCHQLKNYELLVYYFVALNPKQTLPYLDHLEHGFNIEIKEQAEQDSLEIQKRLVPDCKYEMIQGEGELGPLMEHYLKKIEPDLVICGTRNNGVFARWVLGSLSDYLVHHLEVPVVVVKDNHTPNV